LTATNVPRQVAVTLAWRERKIEPVKRELNVLVERDREGLYVASVPELKGCHTQARSLDELMERIREAAELCLDVQGEDVDELEFVGLQRLTIAK
jgi:predicted RNase H-like HicB family nuclease